MSMKKTPQELRRSAILRICQNQFHGLREIAEALDANKHTLRSRYLYPMVREGLLVQEFPPGTKSTQRYKAKN